jgi:hypothetical protein
MSVNLQLRAELPEDAIVFGNMLSYDGSIVGVTTDGRVVYDYDKMVEELMQDEEWSYEDAVEWIEYNTIRSLPYAGENAPIIMYRILE